jgi:hypothetical protein
VISRRGVTFLSSRPFTCGGGEQPTLWDGRDHSIIGNLISGFIT